MTYETLILDSHDTHAQITLNRPDALNSVNALMLEELPDALETLRDSGNCRALLLTGAGRAFCAGQDLADKAAVPDEGPTNLGALLKDRYNPLITTLQELPFPVVCAVNGVAAGAGANLALACDIVLAAKSAKFIQAFCKIGLVPDCGGTWMLARLVGFARAKALALLGEAIMAEQAQAWGMIWRAVEDETLLHEAQTLTHKLATQPTHGLNLIKQAFLASATNSLSEQLELESEYQQLAGQSDDFREGVQAFIQKRKPIFTGR
jgi:2-(1,2-epoxy-1,2-dihydrophenyl)acetyl-CoA isomerase